MGSEAITAAASWSAAREHALSVASPACMSTEPFTGAARSSADCSVTLDVISDPTDGSNRTRRLAAASSDPGRRLRVDTRLPCPRASWPPASHPRASSRVTASCTA
eukprot:3710822-Prymnesium_polylepis.3